MMQSQIIQLDLYYQIKYMYSNDNNIGNIIIIIFKYYVLNNAFMQIFEPFSEELNTNTIQL